MTSELERIAALAKLFALSQIRGEIRVGIGDDAAVLTAPAEPLVWTIDAQVEGTHFRRTWLSWEDVGWRSFMAAASDLAAMGARPVAALSALALAGDVDVEALAAGQAAAAREIGAPIVGGNLARATETSITTTLIGATPRPILRSGARAGDGVYVGGAIGLAAAGLAALEGGIDDPRFAPGLAAWRRPRALIALGLALRDQATAAIDLSDGLLRDASHVAVASGVAIVLEEAALLAHAGAALASAARALGREPLGLVLEGGEDYALLATSPGPIAGFTRIGAVEAGAPALVLLRSNGEREAVSAKGFDHFAP